tara:strand:- start:676 stop:981 length:306 start_codon:yes stop_codon:yes gene_type:complete
MVVPLTLLILIKIGLPSWAVGMLSEYFPFESVVLVATGVPAVSGAPFTNKNASTKPPLIMPLLAVPFRLRHYLSWMSYYFHHHRLLSLKLKIWRDSIIFFS